jgi:hypothetical protein
MNLSRMLNDRADDGTKLDGYTYHNCLILIGYRLLHISPLGGPRHSSPLENVFGLGLMAFMTTFLHGLNGRIPVFARLSELARSAIRGHFDEEENLELLLWTLFIGRAAIFSQLDDSWLVPKTQITIQALDLHTWEHVCQTLSKFPWVNALHGKPGQALWRKSTPGDNYPIESQSHLSPSIISSHHFLETVKSK